MRHFAIVSFVVTLSVVSATLGSDVASATQSDGSGSQAPVLLGVEPVANEEPLAAVPSPMPGALSSPNPSSVPGTPALATCDRCHREWTDCCCPERHWTFFGEWLLLQPRGADPVFAVDARACTSPSLGAAHQIDFGVSSGFKIGADRWLSDGMSQIGVNWLHFEANDSARANAKSGQVLRPLLTDPALDSCDALTSTTAAASASFNIDRVDLLYRQLIECGCTRWNWEAGIEHAQLTQDLRVRYDTDRVNADSSAWGFGPKVGVGAECGNRLIRGYGHADFTLLASNARASYRQVSTFDGIAAKFSQDLDRINPVLDLEAGIAVDVTKHVTLTGGYMYSIWFNVVTGPDFVAAARHGDITGDSGATLTFDGLFVRLELNW